MNDQLDIIDVLESKLARLLGWVRAAESRLALILPLSTAMLGLLAIYAPQNTHWSILSAITTALAVLFLVLSIVFTAIATFPRTAGPPGSLIYFGSIAALDYKQFAAATASLSKEDYVADLVKQCHRNAQIADRKYAWIQKAMACLFLSSVPWVASLFTLYGST